jgi:tryptophanyl-tRNA synthetase (EC 6.1.1.2)
MYSDRVLSGMRPTGRLHLGHYHGVLKNWLRLQNEYQCLFFVADWHALTTHYDTPQVIDTHVRDMVVDWLAAGIDPAQATLFVQSRVIEHAELHLLLSMMTPLGWLERVPTYKDQQEKLSEKDLSTYGFLGYPLLQSADILIYRANLVPVGEDQVPHIEFTREICRRFNHLYGREVGFEDKAQAAVKKLGSKKSRVYEECRTAYQQQGDVEALESARAMLNDAQNLSLNDRERLFGYLEGSGKMILAEPEALLTEASKIAGPGRPENVQVVSQHDRPARRPRAGHEKKSAPCRPILRACVAPMRAIRTIARCGSSIAYIRTTRPASGSPTDAPVRVSVASNASSR